MAIIASGGMLASKANALVDAQQLSRVYASGRRRRVRRGEFGGVSVGMPTLQAIVQFYGLGCWDNIVGEPVDVELQRLANERNDQLGRRVVADEETLATSAAFPGPPRLRYPFLALHLLS